MTILITGGSGALGRALQQQFPDAYCPSHSEFDVTNKEQVPQVLKEKQPEMVIHAAAMVGIRECEEKKVDAWTTNVEGTQHIVDALNKLDNKPYLIYISTACVFAGEQEKYYTEEDTPSPKNFYSLTKLCGELIVKNYPNSLIIRTNFVPKEPWKYPKAFTDRFGTYLFARNVAQGLAEVTNEKKTGIIHVVGDKRMSMYDLAKLAGSPDVGMTTLKEYDGPALTVDMSLSTAKWKKYTIDEEKT